VNIFFLYFYPKLFLSVLKKYIIYIVFVFSGWQALTAQEILVQWTGVVRDELLKPIPYAHIIVQKDYRGTATDLNGRFTIITYPRDTLYISCIGYKPVKIPVPNIRYDDSKHYIKDIILEEDVISLSEVVIYPWKTYREFREAFLALELPEDDLQRAYHNIAIIQEQIYNAIINRPSSPSANFRDVTNSRTNRMMNYGHMYPTYQIGNPLAWAQFFQALRNGEFQKRENTAPARKPTLVEDYNMENAER